MNQSNSTESTEPTTRTLTREEKILKYNAVDYLLSNGLSGSEWQEAGLLNAIQKVMNPRTLCEDLSRSELDRLLEDAANN
jgi:hypothetical protein